MRPKYDETAGRVYEHMEQADGSRALTVDVAEGVQVLVRPIGSDKNEPAKRVATAIADQALAAKANQIAIDGLQHANESLASQLHQARQRIAQLEAINEAAVRGRRRFFGPVLLQPVKPGDWSGEVWLLDPTKQGNGYGLRFASLAELRRLHPELWIVGVSTFEGILLDALEPQPSTTREL